MAKPRRQPQRSGELALDVVAEIFRRTNATLPMLTIPVLDWGQAPVPINANGSRLPGYKFVQTYDPPTDRLMVMVCWQPHAGRWFWYVSYSRPGRVPDYHDTLTVRRAFVPRDWYCCQVFPPERHHVNQHPYCLHLWAPEPGQWPFPEFSTAEGI